MTDETVSYCVIIQRHHFSSIPIYTYRDINDILRAC